MKYERLTGASGAALSLLLLAGCGGPEDARDSKAELPAAVRQQIGGHILQLTYEDAKGSVHRSTAVRVTVAKGKTIDIVAAHAAARAVENCADQELARKTSGRVEYFTPAKQSSVKEYEAAVNQGRSTVDRPELEGHDIAGIIKSDDEDKYGGISPVETLDIKTGDTMTFINYQEAPSGTSRDVTSEDKYGQPAMFTGAYIGMEGTKMVALTGGGVSYGSIDEKVTRDGSSGGAAFVNNKQTSLAGITTETSNYTVSRQDVQERFGVTMNVSSDSRLTYIEPVTTTVVQELYANAATQPECTTS